jgi:TRAP-type C4-dicarboxylate transport system substrate-binding protein
MVGIAFVGAFAGITLAETGKVFKWKFASHMTPATSYGKQQAEWCKWVEKRTNGRLILKPYWKGEICGPRDIIKAIKSGLAETGGFVPAYTPGQTPLWNVTFLPFLGPARVDHTMIATYWAAKHWALMEESNKWNAVYVGGTAVGGYEIMGNKPIRKAEDFDGVRIRATGDIGKTFKKFGAIPMTVPISEVYTALSTGVVDAVCSSGPRSQFGHKLYEHSKYYIRGLGVNDPPTIFAINKDKWAELPDDIKNIFPTLQYDFTIWMQESEYEPAKLKEIADTYKEKGIETIDFPPEERAKLVAQARGVWQDWIQRSNLGEAGKQVLEAFIAASEAALKIYPDGVK